MRFGFCASIQDAPLLKELGYDYLECVLRDLDGMSPGQLREARELLSETGLAAEAFNCFYGPQRLVGEDATPLPELLDYTNRVLERAAELGGRIAVYGSGRARHIPEGFSRERARGQFCEAVWHTAQAARQFGITLVLEPLNAGETNFFHTVEEGAGLVKEIGHENLFLLADWYHVCREGEPFAQVVQAGPLLRHIHLAEPVNRRVPRMGDGADYGAMGAALTRARYQGRISIEAIHDPARTLRQEAEEGLEVLRRYFK